MFEPFERFNVEEDIEGTGIGLTITKELVDIMGGNIKVETKVNEDSTFWVELKMANTGNNNE